MLSRSNMIFTPPGRVLSVVIHCCRSEGGARRRRLDRFDTCPSESSCAVASLSDVRDRRTSCFTEQVRQCGLPDRNGRMNCVVAGVTHPAALLSTLLHAIVARMAFFIVFISAADAVARPPRCCCSSWRIAAEVPGTTFGDKNPFFSRTSTIISPLKM